MSQRMELRSDSLNPVLLGMGRGSLSLILVNPSLGYGYIVHSIHYSVEWALLSILNQRVNQRASFAQLQILSRLQHHLGLLTLLTLLIVLNTRLGWSTFLETTLCSGHENVKQRRNREQ